jgi:CheY-like chemotaxis protein
LQNPAREILLVDDNENDVELTLLALQTLKLANAIVHLRDGVEALEYLRGERVPAQPRVELPLLVLLDIKMPRMDGLEVLRQVRSDPKLALTPIVIMTSSREQSDLHTAYELGANAYVVKPVQFEEFRKAVSALGMFWGLLNESPAAAR